MGERVCIHANRLPHQRHWAGGLKEAFKAHGFECEITEDPQKESDIHVVLGPHFAKQYHLDHKTILLDRCYYRGDPEHISLGWMNPDGSRTFYKGEGREPPTVKPMKTGDRTLFLADWRGPVEEADTVRYHPAEHKATETLQEAISRHDVAIGYGTTALVEAALEGLRIVCKDPRHILNQHDWLNLLPYADWAYEELTEAVAFLMEKQ
ncbi:hypothetical protein [Litorivivens sp.]|uniref:hypothetical protein n=1 Tax=Litorivivens sp. TaxID=2020868 RepID=UPI00356363CD